MIRTPKRLSCQHMIHPHPRKQHPKLLSRTVPSPPLRSPHAPAGSSPSSVPAPSASRTYSTVSHSLASPATSTSTPGAFSARTCSLEPCRPRQQRHPRHRLRRIAIHPHGLMHAVSSAMSSPALPASSAEWSQNTVPPWPSPPDTPVPSDTAPSPAPHTPPPGSGRLRGPHESHRAAGTPPGDAARCTRAFSLVHRVIARKRLRVVAHGYRTSAHAK